MASHLDRPQIFRRGMRADGNRDTPPERSEKGRRLCQPALSRLSDATGAGGNAPLGDATDRARSPARHEESVEFRLGGYLTAAHGSRVFLRRAANLSRNVRASHG